MSCGLCWGGRSPAGSTYGPTVWTEDPQITIRTRPCTVVLASNNLTDHCVYQCVDRQADYRHDEVSGSLNHSDLFVCRPSLLLLYAFFPPRRVSPPPGCISPPPSRVLPATTRLTTSGTHLSSSFTRSSRHDASHHLRDASILLLYAFFPPRRVSPPPGRVSPLPGCNSFVPQPVSLIPPRILPGTRHVYLRAHTVLSPGATTRSAHVREHRLYSARRRRAGSGQSQSPLRQPRPIRRPVGAGTAHASSLSLSISCDLPVPCSIPT